MTGRGKHGKPVSAKLCLGATMEFHLETNIFPDAGAAGRTRRVPLSSNPQRLHRAHIGIAQRGSK